MGKEIVFSVTSQEIKNGKKFYTDSNGLFTVERTYGEKEGYDVSLDSPTDVQFNYYPVTSAISIEDESATNKKRLTLMNDRAQGGTSRQSGQMELMIHRSFSSGEELQEIQTVHSLILSRGNDSHLLKILLLFNHHFQVVLK